MKAINPPPVRNSRPAATYSVGRPIQSLTKGDEGEGELQQKGTDDGTGIVAETADHDHRPDQKGFRTIDLLRPDETDVMGKQKTRYRRQHAGCGHQLALEGDRIVTERGGELRFLPHHPDRQAVTAADQMAAQQPGGNHKRQNSDEDGDLPRLAVQTWIKRRDAADTLRTTGQPVLVGCDDADDLCQRQRDDAPIVRLEVAAEACKSPAQQSSREHRENEAGNRTEVKMEGDRRPIGAAGKQRDLAEIHQAAETGLKVEAQCEQCVKAGHDSDVDYEIRHA